MTVMKNQIRLSLIAAQMGEHEGNVGEAWNGMFLKESIIIILTYGKNIFLTLLPTEGCWGDICPPFFGY